MPDDSPMLRRAVAMGKEIAAEAKQKALAVANIEQMKILMVVPSSGAITLAVMYLENSAQYSLIVESLRILGLKCEKLKAEKNSRDASHSISGMTGCDATYVHSDNYISLNLEGLQKLVDAGINHSAINVVRGGPPVVARKPGR